MSALAHGISLRGLYAESCQQRRGRCQGSFPDNPFNIHEDYGRASFDIRNRVVVGGTITLKHGFLLSPLMNFQSGTPFNITIGQDLIGSTIFNQRPSFATASTPAADIVSTKYGAFNIDPAPGAPLIPVNFGQGPNSFVMNLRVTKTFSFGSRARRTRVGRHGGSASEAAPEAGRRPSGVSALEARLKRPEAEILALAASVTAAAPADRAAP